MANHRAGETLEDAILFIVAQGSALPDVELSWSIILCIST